MKLNSIFLSHKKGTENSETIKIPLPSKVRISMAQHMGAPCEPIVKKGDTVAVGQKIGESSAFMSCPVHSSVSGTVSAIVEILNANGKTCKAVEIETDGLQTVSDEVKPPVITDKASLCEAVRESGCCGMGGAGFPTHIKLNFDESKYKVDTLVINAAECEPYITSDYREMLEDTEDVLTGIKLVKNMLGLKKAVIGIEDNKPKAIKLMKEKTASDSDIEVMTLRSCYPQGAEKVIIFNTTGRIVGEGQLPSDQGVIVMNVTTAGFIGNYSKTGMPLISKRITVDGDIVATPCNVKAPIGTSAEDILKFADCNVQAVRKALFGGPMMGMCLYDLETPITKTCNAILAFKEKSDDKNGNGNSKGKIEDKCAQTNCIKCGRCISACPLNLMPTELEKAYDRRDKEALEKLKVGLCMNCGSCSYVCPAKRDLAEKNQLAKAFVRS